MYDLTFHTHQKWWVFISWKHPCNQHPHQGSEHHQLPLCSLFSHYQAPKQPLPHFSHHRWIFWVPFGHLLMETRGKRKMVLPWVGSTLRLHFGILIVSIKAMVRAELAIKPGPIWKINRFFPVFLKHFVPTSIIACLVQYCNCMLNTLPLILWDIKFYYYFFLFPCVFNMVDVLKMCWLEINVYLCHWY